MEKIKSIKEAEFTAKAASGSYEVDYSGFIVTTDKQEIKVGIENEQLCCEAWGYIISEDNLEDFVGAVLAEVYLTDTALKTYEDLPEEGDLFHLSDCMFVNFVTSAGLLQFVAYNEHNGYYGHDAVVVSEKINHSEVL